MRFAAAFMFLTTLWALPAHAEEVDLELVLAADGSGSIDADEMRLQRDGYAEAIQSPEVLSGIRDGAIGAIAIAYVEWGGQNSQHTIVDWHVIRDAASAADFAAKVRTRPRQAYGYNSISGALLYAAKMMRENIYEAPRKVIDVSGDGPQIGGPPLPPARAAVLDEGIVINGLVINRGASISAARGSLVDHYNNEVIGGPGSFTVVVTDTANFASAVRAKLVREIATAPPAASGRRAQTEMPTPILR